MVAITEANICNQLLHGSHLSSAVSRIAVRPCGPNASDEVLIEAIAQGDRQAMEALYARHNKRVYRFILRISGNAAMAEDIVSDVFLDVWRHADRFQAKSQVSTWLLAIARNKTLSTFRHRTDEQLDDDTAATIKDPTDDPEISVYNKDRSAVIRRCLSQLSTVQREVIDLAYYHEKTVEEVAQIVGAPATTVKTRMFYARNRMEELLKSAGFDSL